MSRQYQSIAEVESTACRMREDTEMDYVSMALTACCRHVVDAQSLLAVVTPDMIQRPVSADIYRAMSLLAGQGKDITLPAVWTVIREMQTQEPATWVNGVTAEVVANYAISVLGNVESAVWQKAHVVRGEAMKRAAEAELVGLAAECRRYGNDPAEVAAGLRALADRLEGGGSESVDMSALVSSVVESIKRGTAAKPLPTPWPRLNRVLKGGLVPGELAILAARPGMGKTALAGCFAVEVARKGIPVLFVSREVKDTTLTSRMLAREAHVDNRVFRQGIEHAPNILPAIEKAGAVLGPLPLRIVEKSIAPMTPREVRRIAKTCKGVGLIIVDYLQLLCPDAKQNSREREVAEMSRGMKQLALDCDCPVLLLSQLSRAVEETQREPRLSDLRESGAIEQDADIVIFLHARKGCIGLTKTPVQAIVAKGRSSGTGQAHLLFDKPFADFIEDVDAAAWADSLPSSKAMEGDL